MTAAAATAVLPLTPQFSTILTAAGTHTSSRSLGRAPMTATTAQSALRRPGTPSGCRSTRWGPQRAASLCPCHAVHAMLRICIFTPLRPRSLHSYKPAVSHSHMPCNASHPQVILLSDDADNRHKAEEMGVTALSSAAYARQRAAEGQAELQVGWCMWPHSWMCTVGSHVAYTKCLLGANVPRCSLCNTLSTPCSAPSGLVVAGPGGSRQGGRSSREECSGGGGRCRQVLSV